MSRRSLNVVAPRWRHFIPQGESVNLQIPHYETVRDASGNVTTIQKFDLTTTVKENYVGEGKQYVFALPRNVPTVSTDAITISLNDVVQSNAVEVLYYEMVGLTAMPEDGRSLFEYDAATNSILFQFVEGHVNRAPALGTRVRIEIVSTLPTNNIFMRIPISKEYLIQGANPIDSNLVKPDGTGVNEFQGGYRCTLKLISQAAHGVVRVSDDKFAFEYRPDLGYFGVDSFAYRLVNALGQESAAYCIRLDVGTNQLPSGE